MTTRPPFHRLRRIEPVLRRALRGDCAPCAEHRVLVAVSGGPDSTALLVGLHRVGPELGVALAAAHLHHGLRGADADADLAHVRELARRLELPLVASRCDAREVMARRGLSGQDGLRRLRRTFLIRAARRAGAELIATGHTANDQAETLLMRLGRGAGLDGLAGIAPRRGRWIRPLLRATRADIEADLGRAGIAWREDASNRDEKSLRSRMRHGVLPALARSFAPDAPNVGPERSWVPQAVRSTEELRSARDVLHHWAERKLTSLCVVREGEVRLDSNRVATYPLALRRALFRQVWKRIAPRSIGLTRRHLEALDCITRTPGDRLRIQLPGGIVAENGQGTLCVRVPGSSGG